MYKGFYHTPTGKLFSKECVLMNPKSKKKPPVKANQKLLQTDNPDLMVKVSIRGSGNNMYLVGDGVDARTGRKIEKTTVKRKLQIPESLDHVTSTVVYQVQQKFSDLQASQKPKTITHLKASIQMH